MSDLCKNTVAAACFPFDSQATFHHSWESDIGSWVNNTLGSVPWSGRGSRRRSWRAPGWGWCRTRCRPGWRWSGRWPCSAPWPAQSMPSSPGSPSVPGEGRRLRCRLGSTVVAPRPLTPPWMGSPAQNGRILSSPGSRSVTGSSSLWYLLCRRKCAPLQSPDFFF